MACSSIEIISEKNANLEVISTNILSNEESTSRNDQNAILSYDTESDQEITDTEDYDCFDYLGENYKVPLDEYKMKGYNSRLSNKASNDLKKLSHCKQIRNSKTNKTRDQIMEELCINQFAETLLDKIVTVTSLINNSEDNIILHANRKAAFSHKLPQECVLKIYKNTLPEFKQWEKYIKDGHYFKDKLHKQINKDVIQKKAEREKQILMKLQEIDVKCPRVITLKKGVLVTTFIGKNKKAASKLKQAVLTKEEYYSAFMQMLGIIWKMYNANLVIDTISEDTILWYKKTCYLTSVSRCVERSHKDAFDFLYRNLSNMFNFFYKKDENITKNLSPRYKFYSFVSLEYDDKKHLKKLGELYKTESYVNMWRMIEKWKSEEMKMK